MKVVVTRGIFPEVVEALSRRFDVIHNAEDRPWPPEELAARLAAGDAAIDWPDGETALALRSRVTTAWSALIADPRPTVVVSHAGPLRLVLALVRGRPPDEVALPTPATAIRLSFRAAATTAAVATRGPAAEEPPRATLRR